MARKPSVATGRSMAAQTSAAAAKSSGCRGRRTGRGEAAPRLVRAPTVNAISPCVGRQLLSYQKNKGRIAARSGLLHHCSASSASRAVVEAHTVDHLGGLLAVLGDLGQRQAVGVERAE